MRDLEAKRQEIRKVLEAWNRMNDCVYPDKECEHRYKEGWCDSVNEAYKCLTKRLDELGVGLKVDLKIPENSYYPERGAMTEALDIAKQRAFNEACQKFKELNKGFEPL